MNGKQVQALALTLLVASSCMATPAWLTSFGASCKKTWTDHPRYVIGGTAAAAVAATTGGVAWRKHVLAKRAQKAEAQRLESRPWIVKKFDAARGYFKRS